MEPWKGVKRLHFHTDVRGSGMVQQPLLAEEETEPGCGCAFQFRHRDRWSAVLMQLLLGLQEGSSHQPAFEESPAVLIRHAPYALCLTHNPANQPLVRSHMKLITIELKRCLLLPTN